jgi:hypothetical protein
MASDSPTSPCSSFMTASAASANSCFATASKTVGVECAQPGPSYDDRRSPEQESQICDGSAVAVELDEQAAGGPAAPPPTQSARTAF